MYFLGQNLLFSLFFEFENNQIKRIIDLSEKFDKWLIIYGKQITVPESRKKKQK